MADWKNTKGSSPEALKLAAAMLIAFGVFLIFVAFAGAPQKAEETFNSIGENLLNFTENASLEILNSP